MRLHLRIESRMPVDSPHRFRSGLQGYHVASTFSRTTAARVRPSVTTETLLHKSQQRIAKVTPVLHERVASRRPQRMSLSLTSAAGSIPC